MKYKLIVNRTPAASAIEFTPATSAERETCLALKAVGKLKKPKTQKSGFVAFDERLTVAQKFVGFILRRVEFPRHGEPFPLSPTDRADATQAGLLACLESGFFRNGVTRATLRAKDGELKITYPVLKAVRNAIQGKACLRMRCQRETLTEKIAEIAAEIGFATEYEVFASRLTVSQVDAAREIMRTLRAAKKVDAGRKAKKSFEIQRDFFLLQVDCMTGKIHLPDSKTGKSKTVSASGFRDRKAVFIDYLAQGEKFLRATRKPANLGEEIMQALRDRVNPPKKVSRLARKLAAIA